MPDLNLSPRFKYITLICCQLREILSIYRPTIYFHGNHQPVQGWNPGTIRSGAWAWLCCWNFRGDCLRYFTGGEHEDNLSERLGLSLGLRLRGNLRETLGGDLGSTFGANLGTFLGATFWATLGSTLGSTLGRTFGETFGPPLGEKLGKPWG